LLVKTIPDVLGEKMSRKINFILTNSGTLNLVASGKVYVVPRDHPNYNRIKDAVKGDRAEDLENLVNIAKAVETFAQSAPIGTGEKKVTVKDGVVYWGNEIAHNAVSERILVLMRDGFDFNPMALFLGNLMKNPSYRSVQELYKFLDRQGLPITEDGCFLGYKRVSDNYTDLRTGTIDNRVGCKPSMERNTVDDNWRVACSSGFHVGSIEYVRGFHAGQGHVMIVKVDPQNVVSVPDYDTTKLRACTYEVIGEITEAALREIPLSGSLYTPTGTPSTPTEGMGGYGHTGDDVEEDWDDEEDYDDDEDYDDEEDEDEDEDEDDYDVEMTEVPHQPEPQPQPEPALSLAAALVLSLAKTLPQPFTRVQLDELTKRANGTENDVSHNHEVDKAFWELVERGKLFSDGDTIRVS
jgi:hypothetical protein